MKHKTMKDSRVKWAKEIPTHWKVEKAKFHFTLTNERGNKTPILLAASQKYGMYPQNLLDGVVKVAEKTDLQQFKTVHKNDFVISLRSFQGGFEHSDYEGVCSPAYQVFRADTCVYNIGYLKFLFKNEMFIDEMNSLTVGIREGKNIKYEDFANSFLFIPPIEEQSAIAEYLDNQCAKIDTLIDEAKSSIEEYKKWKASLIFETVTKGLDPNVEMKDSGVKWLSKVPKKFNIKPLKQIVVNRNGGVWGNNPNGTENDRICMRIADFSFDSGRFKEMPLSMYTLRNYTASQIDKFTLQRGDICIEKSGGGEKTPVGRAVLFDLPLKALYANFMESISVDSNIIMPEFVEYFWRGMYYKSVPTAYIKQTTGIQNLNISSLLEKEYILIPDKEEQKSIVEYLDSICATIDSLIDIKFKLIEDIKLYKQSIIFETVTGKRKVV